MSTVSWQLLGSSRTSIRCKRVVVTTKSWAFLWQRQNSIRVSCPLAVVHPSLVTELVAANGRRICEEWSRCGMYILTMPQRTLTFLAWKPPSDLSTDLMMSHFRRVKRSRHLPASWSYVRLSNTICVEAKVDDDSGFRTQDLGSRGSFLPNTLSSYWAINPHKEGDTY